MSKECEIECLSQCSFCKQYSDDVKYVTEYEEYLSSWGYMLCVTCTFNREAVIREDLRIQFGAPD